MPWSCMMFMTSIRDSKKKKKKIFRPTYPNFLGHVTRNTHTFLFGLISFCFKGLFIRMKMKLKCEKNTETLTWLKQMTLYHIIWFVVPHRVSVTWSFGHGNICLLSGHGPNRHGCRAWFLWNKRPMRSRMGFSGWKTCWVRPIKCCRFKRYQVSEDWTYFKWMRGEAKKKILGLRSADCP